ncbi:hypothetical protein LF41_1436 [Lysobacter dokdonensis DS-58]|uniref:Uncharacterized protein n=2 Tax=Noviluteimonas TaxID=3382693 RepID=A0A0A2WH99_9GAMM|nr:hypothetical protein LF41_1436 [Lysobacter dokdonensis DS-58]
MLASAAVPTLGVFALMLFFIAEDGWADWVTLVVAVTFAAALLHLCFLGLPAIYWLISKQKFRAWPMALTGAIVAAIPVSILTFPYAPWADPSDTLADLGVAVLLFASAGAVSALAFYGVCRAMAKPVAAV